MEEFQKKLRSRRRQYGKSSKYTRQQQALISSARDSLLSFTHKSNLPQLHDYTPSNAKTISSLYELSNGVNHSKKNMNEVTFSSTQPIYKQNHPRFNLLSNADGITSGVLHSSERPLGMPAIPPSLSTALPLPSIRDEDDKQIWYIVMNTNVVSESGFKRSVRTPIGPLSVIHLRQLFASNEISLKTLFWREGFSKWSQLSQLNDLRTKLTNLPHIQQEVADLPEFDYEHIPLIPMNTAPKDFYSSETLDFVDTSNAVELSKHELLYGVYQDVEPSIDKPCALCGELSIVQLPCSIENEELDIENENENQNKSLRNDDIIDPNDFEYQFEKTLDYIHQIHRSEDQVGATEHCSEILNGFLWIGEQEAAKHRTIVSLKLTMLINCTEELETPPPMPPYYRTNTIPFPRSLQPTEIVEVKSDLEISYDKTIVVKTLTEIEKKKFTFYVLSSLEEAYDWLEFARLFPDKLSLSDSTNQTPFSETDSYGNPIKSRAENIYIRAYNQTHGNKSTNQSVSNTNISKSKMSFLQSSGSLFGSENATPLADSGKFFVQTPKLASTPTGTLSRLSSQNFNFNNIDDSNDYQIMNPKFLKSFRMNSTTSMMSNNSHGTKADSILTKPNTVASKIPLSKLTTSRVLLYSEKGEDRPVLIAAAYLIKRFSISVLHALKIISQKRPVSDISPQSMEILTLWSTKYSSALNVKRAIKTMKTESAKIIGELNSESKEKVSLKSNAHYNMIRLCLDCKDQSIRSAQVKLKKILSNIHTQEEVKDTNDIGLVTYQTDFSDIDPRESIVNNGNNSTVKKKLLMMMIQKGGNSELFGIDKHGNYIEKNPPEILIKIINSHLKNINEIENCDFSNLMDTKMYLKPLRFDVFEFSKFSGLVDLELSNRFLSDRTISYLFTLLGDIKQLHKIRNLDLSYNSLGFLSLRVLLEVCYPHIDPDDIFMMHNTLFVNPDKDPRILNDIVELTHLNLTRTNINDHLASKYLCFLLQNCNSLVTLNLFDNNLRDDLLGDILSCLVTSTHSFDAHNRKNDSDTHDNIVTKILFNQSITSLNIGRNNILDNATYNIKQVLKFNVVLTKLTMDMAFGLSPTSIKEICHAAKLYSRTMQELSFNGISLSVKSMEFIARIHDSVSSAVKVLNMADCNLYYLHLKTLCPLLSFSHTLIELNLSGNPIGDRGALAIASFIRGIGFTEDHEILSYEESKKISKSKNRKSKNNPFNGSKNYYSTKNSIVVNIPPLKILNLNCCKLTPRGCAIIAYGLRDRTYNVASAIEAKNNSDHTVRIYDKQSVEYSISLNDDTLITSHFQRLEYVDLSYNNIGSNNSIFYYAISESQVEDLQLNYCNLRTQGAIEILKALKRNPGPSVNPPYDDYKKYYKNLLEKRNSILEERKRRRLEKHLKEEEEKNRIKQLTIAKLLAEEDEFYDKDDIALLGYSSEELIKSLKNQDQESQLPIISEEKNNLEEIKQIEGQNIFDESNKIATLEESMNEIQINHDDNSSSHIENAHQNIKQTSNEDVKILESSDAFSNFIISKTKNGDDQENIPKGIFNLLSKDIKRIVTNKASSKVSVDNDDDYDSDDFDEYCDDSEDDDEIDEFGLRLPILPSSSLSESLRFLGLSGNEISNRCSKFLKKLITNNFMIEQVDLGFNQLNDACVPDLQESISIHSNSSVAKKSYELHVNLLGNPFKKDYPLETPGKMRGKLQFGFGIAPNSKDPRREGYGHIASRTRTKFIKQKQLDNQFRQLYPTKPISNIV